MFGAPRVLGYLEDMPLASSREMTGNTSCVVREGPGLEDLWRRVMNEQCLCAFVSVITKGGFKPFVKKVMRLSKIG